MPQITMVDGTDPTALLYWCTAVVYCVVLRVCVCLCVVTSESLHIYIMNRILIVFIWIKVQRIKQREYEIFKIQRIKKREHHTIYINYLWRNKWHIKRRQYQTFKLQRIKKREHEYKKRTQILIVFIWIKLQRIKQRKYKALAVGTRSSPRWWKTPSF